MISAAKLALIEFVLVAVSVSVLWRFSDELGNFLGSEEQLSMLFDNLFQINIALVIAFVIGIFAEGGLKYRGRNLKTISRNMLMLFMVNTVIIALFPIFGKLYLPIVLICFVGNIVEFMNVSKNIINAIK